MTNSIRLLIADDHTLLRNALAELLHAEDGLDVVATAGSVPEALRLAARHRPHVVLLDIEMPGNHHPLSTIRQFQYLLPGVRILVLTMRDDPAVTQSLLPLCIPGILHKTVTHQALCAAVREACQAGSGAVTVLLSADGLMSTAPENGPLSPREREVIEFAAQGLSNYQIARRLDIAEGTVKRHMHSIFDKLTARCRVEAVNRAVELGLIDPPVSALPRRRPDTVQDTRGGGR
ncbi:response regulator transcription factor [Streptomyces sp. SL13]|uniref:Response regulator transcription factor n=1 Tax=Streptantibioticus silvisoli TaxID=2705255 RepID=A0AA90JWA8_9ACTN|nr:response regulator transcription factor [Streptantibioticus silvisoli]MDI5961327.1 response regulator transcription factor [Streptantibioticus silvisoli]MDI5968831.1 response regulator transcription factor [Streptantibioticus silvisoli]